MNTDAPCSYCTARGGALLHAQAQHSVWALLPPVDLYQCVAGGSHFTHPLPASQLLQQCLARVGSTRHSIAPIWPRYSTRYLAAAVAPRLVWVPDVLLPLPTGCFLLSLEKPG